MLCSVWPEKVNLPPRPLCPSEMPAPKHGERYSFTMVAVPGQEVMDFANATQAVFEALPTKDVALDIIGLRRERVDETTNPPSTIAAIRTSPYYEMGFFVPEGSEPTEAEISAAEARCRKFMLNALNVGDIEYANRKSPRDVPEPSRVAARFLGVDRDWSNASKPVVQKDCPVCRKTQVPDGARICTECRSEIVWIEGAPVWIKDVPPPAATTDARLERKPLQRVEV